MATQLSSDAKTHVYRLLRQLGKTARLDLLLYTRGGDANAIWPLVSLCREYTDNFSILVPYKAHSGGTLLAFGASRIVMGEMGELGPIDPSTGNQFNPIDETEPGQKARLGISVEDVAAFFDLAKETLVGRPGGLEESEINKLPDIDRTRAWELALTRLSQVVHPLALGNVERVHKQIKKLAHDLLRLHLDDEERIALIVEFFSQKFYSHQHGITRKEAAVHLGDIIEEPTQVQEEAMWDLMEVYSKDLQLETTFNLFEWAADDPRKELLFAGGFIETTETSYAHITRAQVTQTASPPPGLQIQVPLGQQLPLLPGLPRAINVQVLNMGWRENTEDL
jgi:hypothetical protein